MSSHRREQIIENCRWLLDQEVQIITFTTRRYLKNASIPGHSRGPSELHHYAAVLPKQCSLKSLAHSNIEEKIIFKEFSLLSSDGAISTLLGSIEKKIGVVLEEEGGHIQINEDKLPEYIKGDKDAPPQIKEIPIKIKDTPFPKDNSVQIKDIPIQAKNAPTQVNENTEVFTAQSAKLLREVQKSSEEILDNLRKSKELQAELSNFHKASNTNQRHPTNGDENLSTKPAPTSRPAPIMLNNRNLALLEREVTRENPRGTNNLQAPKTYVLQDETSSQLGTSTSGSPSRTDHSGFGRSSAGVNSQLNTPISSAQASPGPILTPTSSDESDTTSTLGPDHITYAMRALIRDEVRLAMKEYQDPNFHIEDSVFGQSTADGFPLYSLTPAPQKFSLHRYM